MIKFRPGDLVYGVPVTPISRLRAGIVITVLLTTSSRGGNELHIMWSDDPMFEVTDDQDILLPSDFGL